MSGALDDERGPSRRSLLQVGAVSAGLIVAGGAVLGGESAGAQLPSGAVALIPVMLATSARVYDSRTHDGVIKAGQTRTVSLASWIPASSYVQGAMLNLTVTHTVGAGYLRVYPRDGTVPVTSSVNWFASNQTLANSALTLVDTAHRAISVYSSGTTQFVVDIVGYLATYLED